MKKNGPSKEKIMYKDGLTTQEYSFKHSLPIEMLLKDSDFIANKTKPEALITKKPNQIQKTILRAYHDLNLLYIEDDEIIIYEDVRKLEYLFWVERNLQSLGFKYVEKNEYNEDSHKIITKNYISTNKKNISILDIQNFQLSDFYLYLSVVMLNKGYSSKNFIYLSNISNNLYNTLNKYLSKNSIKLEKLDISNKVFICRSKNLKQSEKLINSISEFLKTIPCFNDQFFKKTPEASITKKLVFDSAHYITDHDGKCKNLHGGRYDIEITIKDRINPMTGFVMDYSLIKNITKNLIIEKFDHKTLNLTCPELAWRSSTEFLAILIWEILIDYLPNLKIIKIYETETSYCEFVGNSLDEYIKNGPSEILGYFKNLIRENKSSKNAIG